MRLFVDMDGTLAKWNNVAFEQLFEKGYYRNLEPNKRLLTDVKYLIEKGIDVYVLSSYLTDSKYALSEKKEWLNEHLPELPKENQLFVPYGESKAEFFKNNNLSPITSQDFLLDDYTVNLTDWKEWGGTGIKCLNGINHTNKTWEGRIYALEEQFYTTKDGKMKQAEELLFIIDDIKYYSNESAFISTHRALKDVNIQYYSEFQSVLSAYNTVEKIKEGIENNPYINNVIDFQNSFEKISNDYPELNIYGIEIIEQNDNYCMVDVTTKDGVVTFTYNSVDYDIGNFEIMDNEGTVCTLDYHNLCDVACMYLALISEERTLSEIINKHYYSFDPLAKYDVHIRTHNKENFKIALKRAAEDCNFEFDVNSKKATVYGNYSIYDIEITDTTDIKCCIAGTYDGCPAHRRIWSQHLTDADINLNYHLSNMFINNENGNINSAFYSCINKETELKHYIREHICCFTPEEHNAMNNTSLLEKYCREAVEKLIDINLDEIDTTKNEIDICDD